MKHHTRNTVSVSKWCNRCTAYTDHRVDEGREGPCLKCIERSDRERRRATKASAPKQEAFKF